MKQSDDRRAIDLPDGATIEVRPTDSHDAELIRDLYDALPDRDLYRRFFSAYRPDDDWCRSWASVGERGGFGVIALLHHDSDVRNGDPRPIGEAGYALRSDGDGDLAITVAADRRGWLGGYLLDVIVDHAHRSGLANLQADVLVENRQMQSILRHRGAVDLEHDHGTVRLTISTEGFVPSWAPLDPRPRVLVELEGTRWSGERAADRSGLAVAMCSGPSRRRGGCPVLDGRDCPLVEGADAIVVVRDPADPTTHDLIRAHHESRPSVPVFVRSVDRLPGDLALAVEETPGDVSETVGRLTRAIAERARGQGESEAR